MTRPEHFASSGQQIACTQVIRLPPAQDTDRGGSVEQEGQSSFHWISMSKRIAHPWNRHAFGSGTKRVKEMPNCSATNQFIYHRAGQECTKLVASDYPSYRRCRDHAPLRKDAFKTSKLLAAKSHMPHPTVKWATCTSNSIGRKPRVKTTIC